jgi:hypothetical protein
MWRVEHVISLAPYGSGVVTLWEVTDENAVFKTEAQQDAEWLCALLNHGKHVRTPSDERACLEPKSINKETYG